MTDDIINEICAQYKVNSVQVKINSGDIYYLIDVLEGNTYYPRILL